MNTVLSIIGVIVLCVLVIWPGRGKGCLQWY